VDKKVDQISSSIQKIFEKPGFCEKNDKRKTFWKLW